MNETLKKLLEALAVQPVTLDDGAIDEEATAKAATDRLAALTDAEAFATTAREFLKLHESETFDDLTGRIKGMVPAAEKAELESRLARIEAEKAVAKAFTDGKLVEAQREWALGYAAANPQGFADFCAKASRVAPGPASGVPTGNPPANSDASHAHEFSDAEKAILRNLSLTDEQLAELKKEN